MGAHRKLDRRRAYRCAVGLRKRAGCSFFDAERAAVLDVWPLDMIFVKDNVIQLPLIDHFLCIGIGRSGVSRIRTTRSSQGHSFFS
jgi:hypothetical protein